MNLVVVLVNPDALRWAATAAEMKRAGDPDDLKALTPWPNFGILSGAQLTSKFSGPVGWVAGLVAMGGGASGQFEEKLIGLKTLFAKAMAGEPISAPMITIGRDGQGDIGLLAIAGPLGDLDGFERIPLAPNPAYEAAFMRGLLVNMLKSGFWKDGQYAGKLIFVGPELPSPEGEPAKEQVPRILVGPRFQEALLKELTALRRDVSQFPVQFSKFFVSVGLATEGGQLDDEALRAARLGHTLEHYLSHTPMTRPARRPWEGPFVTPKILFPAQKGLGKLFTAPDLLMASLAGGLETSKGSRITKLGPTDVTVISEAFERLAHPLERLTQTPSVMFVYLNKENKTIGWLCTLRGDTLTFDRLMTAEVQSELIKFASQAHAAQQSELADEGATLEQIQTLLAKFGSTLRKEAPPVQFDFSHSLSNWYGAPASIRRIVASYRETIKKRAPELLSIVTTSNIAGMDEKEASKFEGKLYRSLSDTFQASAPTKKANELPLLPDPAEPVVSDAIHSVVFTIYGPKLGAPSLQPEFVPLHQTKALSLREIRAVIEGIQRTTPEPEPEEAKEGDEEEEATEKEFNPLYALRLWLCRQAMSQANGLDIYEEWGQFRREVLTGKKAGIEDLPQPFIIVGTVLVNSTKIAKRSVLKGMGARASQLTFPKPLQVSDQHGLFLTVIEVPRKPRETAPNIEMLENVYSEPWKTQGLKPYALTQGDASLMSSMVGFVDIDPRTKLLMPALGKRSGSLFSFANVSRSESFRKVFSEQRADESNKEASDQTLAAVVYNEVIKDAIVGRKVGRVAREITAQRAGYAMEHGRGSKGLSGGMAKRRGSKMVGGKWTKGSHVRPSSLEGWGTKQVTQFSGLLNFASALAKELVIGAPQPPSEKLSADYFIRSDGSLSAEAIRLLAEYGVASPDPSDGLKGIKAALHELKAALKSNIKPKPVQGTLPILSAGTQPGLFLNSITIVSFSPNANATIIVGDKTVLPDDYASSSGDPEQMVQAFIESSLQSGLIDDVLVEPYSADSVSLFSMTDGEAVDVHFTDGGGVSVELREGFLDEIARSNPASSKASRSSRYGRTARGSRAERNPSHRNPIPPKMEMGGKDFLPIETAADYVRYREEAEPLRSAKAPKRAPTRRKPQDPELVGHLSRAVHQHAAPDEAEFDYDRIRALFPKAGKQKDLEPAQRLGALSAHDYISRLSRIEPDLAVSRTLQRSPEPFGDKDVIRQIVKGAGFSLDDVADILQVTKHKASLGSFIQPSTAVLKKQKTRRLTAYRPPVEALELSKQGVVIWLSPVDAPEPRLSPVDAPEPRVMTFRKGVWLDLDLSPRDAEGRDDIGFLVSKAVQSAILWLGEKKGRDTKNVVYIGRVGDDTVREVWRPGSKDQPEKLSLASIMRRIQAAEPLPLYGTRGAVTQREQDLQNYAEALSKQPVRRRPGRPEVARPFFVREETVEATEPSVKQKAPDAPSGLDEDLDF